MTGADVIVKCLEDQGVTVVFGYPGVAICPFFESVYNSKQIRGVLVRHETNGGHMASGYARVTRKPAVCITTSGPGATNIITALGTAYADSIPLIAITGQVSTRLLGRDGFQEADITGAAEPFVKHSYVVRDPRDIARVIKEAFHIASTGRRGPVLIDVPVDVQQAEVKYVPAGEVNIRGYKPTLRGNNLQIRRVLDTLSAAKRPLICVGGGSILAEGEKVVREFADKYNIPVVSTMMGIGCMPNTDPLYLGMLGTNGKPYANYAVAECDVFMLVGARVADRAVVKPYKLERRSTSIIHIDVDPAEIGKNLGTTIPLVGDIKVVFEQLLEYDFDCDYSEWNAELAERRAEYVDRRHYDHPHTVNPARFIQTLSRKMDDDAIYLADVGQNQLWSADNYYMKNGRFLTTGGFGTMGFGLGAAVGAAVANPGRRVLHIAGDGSFRMNFNELATVSENNLPITTILFDNAKLAMVERWQKSDFGGKTYSSELSSCIDYLKLANAFGIKAQELDEDFETLEAGIYRIKE